MSICQHQEFECFSFYFTNQVSDIFPFFLLKTFPIKKMSCTYPGSPRSWINDYYAEATYTTYPNLYCTRVQQLSISRMTNIEYIQQDYGWRYFRTFLQVIFCMVLRPLPESKIYWGVGERLETWWGRKFSCLVDG